jgi:hypothetical protein
VGAAGIVDQTRLLSCGDRQSVAYAGRRARRPPPRIALVTGLATAIVERRPGAGRRVELSLSSSADRAADRTSGRVTGRRALGGLPHRRRVIALTGLYS